MMTIRIPSGRSVTFGAYASAWRAVIAMPPHADVKGWDLFSSTAADVRRDMRRMMDDTISRHDRTRRQAALTDARLFLKLDAAAARRAILFECRWCGSPLQATRYLQPHARFCNPGCEHDYHS